nr:MAG TPA: hypothetical protein [Caudoviricetes sp.]DAL51812.1 MAG TPA_asm: hypothetical protein [Caudoviricetes sp.]DAM08589.1 MAG TPA: hypothetical protein [Bacteriophage sp.]DAP77508.1 MAG TPA: hypothetical protein [Caudoviricetes sp.]
MHCEYRCFPFGQYQQQQLQQRKWCSPNMDHMQTE